MSAPSSSPSSSSPSSPDALESKVFRGRIWKYGDDVDTDVIFPGRYTYTAQGREEIAAHALEDLDPSFAAEVRPGDIVVGGRNWGCGSSREQAVTCLLYSGVQMVLATGFSRIFYRNAINQGLWALVATPETVTALRHGDLIEVDLDAGHVSVIEPVEEARPAASSLTFQTPAPELRDIVEAGGLIPHIIASLNSPSTRRDTDTAQSLGSGAPS